MIIILENLIYLRLNLCLKLDHENLFFKEKNFPLNNQI